MGAVIFVDHFLARRLGLQVDPMDRSGGSFNLSVLMAWAMSVGGALLALATVPEMKAFYLPLPAWIACGVLYVVFSKLLSPRVAPAATQA